MRVFLAADLDLAHGLGQLRVLVHGEPGADDVLGMRGGRGGRPGVRDAHEIAAVGLVLGGHRDPQQEVGERKVGQQLPLRDDGLQVVGRFAGEAGVLGEQVGKGRHGYRPPSNAVGSFMPAHLLSSSNQSVGAGAAEEPGGRMTHWNG